MEVLEAIRNRYSCRAYHDTPIEPDKLDRVLEAARLAPSARNLQDWRFVIVTDPDTKQQLVPAANNQAFIAAAPALIVACSESDHVMRCGQPVAPIDVAIALEHIALQAAAEGLATCWIGSFYPEQVRAVLRIPDNIAIIELMPIGYPADKPAQKKRDSLDSIVCWEKWSL